MKALNFTRWSFAAICALQLGTLAYLPRALADGGLVRLRADDGRIAATCFAPANLSRDLAADLTVLVQDLLSGDVVMNAEVDLRFTPPAGARMPLTDPWCRPPRSALLTAATGGVDERPSVRLTHAQSDNKLLQGASVIFPVAGDWRMRLTVRRGAESISQEGSLSIDEPSSRLAVIWPWLALPPCLIGLFALNLRLRFRRRLEE
jgi:hypothetical protein